MRWISACLLLPLLAACAGRPVAAPAAPVDAPSPTPMRDHNGKFMAFGTVLENVSAHGPEHGPQLCGGVRQSLPPQCSGLDIVNWSWADVPHESGSGAKWGDYEMIVTFDGARLTLAATPTVQVHPTANSKFGYPQPSTPCPAPPGGWRPVDRPKATQAAWQQATLVANASAEHAGTWIDQDRREITEDSANDPTVFILNVAYTGNLAAHEAELRGVWGGALCVSQAKRSLSELERIQREAHNLPGLMGSSVLAKENIVEIQVWAYSSARQQQLDQMFGPGAVVQAPLLKPID